MSEKLSSIANDSETCALSEEPTRDESVVSVQELSSSTPDDSREERKEEQQSSSGAGVGNNGNSKPTSEGDTAVASPSSASGPDAAKKVSLGVRFSTFFKEIGRGGNNTAGGGTETPRRPSTEPSPEKAAVSQQKDVEVGVVAQVSAAGEERLSSPKRARSQTEIVSNKSVTSDGSLGSSSSLHGLKNLFCDSCARTTQQCKCHNGGLPSPQPRAMSQQQHSSPAFSNRAAASEGREAHKDPVIASKLESSGRGEMEEELINGERGSGIKNSPQSFLRAMLLSANYTELGWRRRDAYPMTTLVGDLLEKERAQTRLKFKVSSWLTGAETNGQQQKNHNEEEDTPTKETSTSTGVKESSLNRNSSGTVSSIGSAGSGSTTNRERNNKKRGTSPGSQTGSSTDKQLPAVMATKVEVSPLAHSSSNPTLRSFINSVMENERDKNRKHLKGRLQDFYSRYDPKKKVNDEHLEKLLDCGIPEHTLFLQMQSKYGLLPGASPNNRGSAGGDSSPGSPAGTSVSRRRSLVDVSMAVSEGSMSAPPPGDEDGRDGGSPAQVGSSTHQSADFSTPGGGGGLQWNVEWDEALAPFVPEGDFSPMVWNSSAQNSPQGRFCKIQSKRYHTNQLNTTISGSNLNPSITSPPNSSLILNSPTATTSRTLATSITMDGGSFSQTVNSPLAALRSNTYQSQSSLNNTATNIVVDIPEGDALNQIFFYHGVPVLIDYGKLTVEMPQPIGKPKPQTRSRPSSTTAALTGDASPNPRSPTAGSPSLQKEKSFSERISQYIKEIGRGGSTEKPDGSSTENLEDLQEPKSVKRQALTAGEEEIQGPSSKGKRGPPVPAAVSPTHNGNDGIFGLDLALWTATAPEATYDGVVKAHLSSNSAEKVPVEGEMEEENLDETARAELRRGEQRSLGALPQWKAKADSRPAIAFRASLTRADRKWKGHRSVSQPGSTLTAATFSGSNFVDLAADEIVDSDLSDSASETAFCDFNPEVALDVGAPDIVAKV